MIEPVALSATHMETPSLGESVPFLTDLLAFERVSDGPGTATLEHPNSRWSLVVHEAPDAPTKRMNNHWGVRVADNREVDAAYAHITAHRDEYGVSDISAPAYSHGSYSIYFTEPGTNGWEIECFQDVLRKESGGARLGGVRSPHWKEPLSAERFPGRGYVPQAFTHGTLVSTDHERSQDFYTSVLGLDAFQAYPQVIYIKHPDPEQKHYLVCIARGTGPNPFGPNFRNTLTLDSNRAVGDAHSALERGSRELGVPELRQIEERDGRASFLLKDPDHNWWEITGPL